MGTDSKLEEIEIITKEDFEKEIESGKMNIDFWRKVKTEDITSWIFEPIIEKQNEWEEIYSKMHKHREVDKDGK